ncbi:hypothetical protein HG15A2_04860 [Adhaeretor mobilis]|uniref:DUF4350 domain-containing protein n=2 Tax=Adhaeretor mobilis TaxID=1930276 RepID=A0A517MQR7_9BACT|nr:hypothetical protein HG15A2_04860 [Adhaeretor mobilis]
MLTARSVIIAIVSIAIISVSAALISLFWGGETQSTLGRNSYGTRTEGYRAVHDLLEALGYETERALIPAIPESSIPTSYVLWNPRDSVVQTEPAYLKTIANWVRDGGYLVVTPSMDIYERDSDDKNCRRCSEKNCSSCIPISLLGELGLDRVVIEQIELLSPNDSRRSDSKPESLRGAVRDAFRTKQRPTAVYDITCQGEWESLSSQTSRVELPSDRSWEIEHDGLEPLARITVEYPEDNTTGTLAALFSLGKGRVAIISNPYLASNASLDRGDNSVLLTHLITGMRTRVIFDEFYHGLTIRGNAFWLLSKLPYATIVVAILVVVGLWAWRQAIFLGPSRQDKPASRRTLGEYIEAMSRFLLKGRESSKHVLSEVRNGVLWHFCKTLGLPPQQQNVDVVLRLLSKRLPHKASQLEAALKNADVVLDNPRAHKDEILLATRKVSDCLST